MRIGIGIDTGGTYTDAVAYDFDSNRVLAKGKAQTTHARLVVGFGAVLDLLPADLLRQASVVALSTTLATNASVEGKGGRSKLLLLGTTRSVLSWIDAGQTYGLKSEDICCRDTASTFDGKVIDEPDWPSLWTECDAVFSDAEALSVAEAYAVRNGGVIERAAVEKLRERYGVPVVCGLDVADGLNVMERGATALLNARLLPVIRAFLGAAAQALRERGIDAPMVIVRSDGSLMTEEASRMRPVATILSGPAASVLGGLTSTSEPNSLVIDMGGTTTDISLIRDGQPAMADQGIRIGGWRTQVRGVYIDTFALGGDSAIRLRDGSLEICERRVEPICAAAMRWPRMKDDLRELLGTRRFHTLPLHEFLYVQREPENRASYRPAELLLCDRLKDGPCMIGNLHRDIGLDMYRLDSERLEQEGILMRCGLTPTDLMHVRGDYSAFDREAAELGASVFLGLRADWPDSAPGMAAFAEAVYEAVRLKLYRNVVRVLIGTRYPAMKGLDLEGTIRDWVDDAWHSRGKVQGNLFLETGFRSQAALIGIGAPTHLFLPDVAESLGTRCILPEHGEVANAIGAVRADVVAVAHATIRTECDDAGMTGYTIHTSDGLEHQLTWEDARQAAIHAAIRLATAEARRRGALGELTVDSECQQEIVYAKDSQAVDLGGQATARVSGRLSYG